MDADGQNSVVAAEISPEPGLDRRPLLWRILDRFLQEQNIKWILALGVLILLGSSLRLVGTHWSQASPAWKHLILLAYTGVIWGVAYASYWRLALRKTGQCLMGLTVLLIPVSFVGLHAVLLEAGTGWLELLQSGALLAANLALARTASRRIGSHFLRGSQLTFELCFLALSVSGAILPLVPASLWPITTLVLWGLFAIGAVKVNRHVFWLTEAHELPRICGFGPIFLLGSQFLGLFAWQVRPHVPVEWLGLGCVLLAVPILQTADSLARVFQERTGNLVRPLPWSIALPVFVGVLLTIVGVGFAAGGLPFPAAMTPTAGLAAIVLVCVARRTGKQGFVWGALIAGTLAYNFSFVFFREFAAWLIHSGSVAVHEQRLPIAFYGLTYLPLLTVLTAAATWLARRDRSTADSAVASEGQGEFYAQPIRGFVTLLGGLLLALSLSHAKAVFPVCAALAGLFAGQVLAFRSRNRMLLSMVAFVLAAWGLPAFVGQVLQWDVPVDFPMRTMAVAGGLLLFPGLIVDRLSRRLPAGREGAPAQGTENGDVAAVLWSPCSATSFVLLVVITLWRLGEMLWFPGARGLSWCNVALPVLLLVQAFYWTSLDLTRIAYVAIALLGAGHTLLHQPPLQDGVNAAAVISIGLWLSVPLLSRVTHWRLSRAFRQANFEFGLVVLSLVLTAYAIPSLVVAQFSPGEAPAWLAVGIAVVWSFDAARRMSSELFGVLAVGAALALPGAIWRQTTGADADPTWLSVLWSGGAFAAMPLVIGLNRPAARMEMFRRPVTCLVVGCLGILALAALTQLSLPWRIAAGMSVAGLAWFAARVCGRDARQVVWVLVNWHMLVQAAAWLRPGAETLFEFSFADVLGMIAAMSCLFAASLVVWDLLSRPRSAEGPGNLALLHALWLRFGLGLLLICRFLAMEPLAPLEVVLLLGTFLLFVGEVLWMACRHQDVFRVWIAETIVVAGLVFFWRFGWVTLGSVWGMYAVLAAAVLVAALSRVAARYPTTNILAGPLATTALYLPLATVGLALIRHASQTDEAWLGASSLAVLLAAAAYFWRAIELRQKRWIVLAGGIANLALGLLWHELNWSDPQFYMIPLGLSVIGLVELLRQEIPERFHDTLRYAGALTILVSPTFHIVEGSWLHLISLLVVALLVVLLAIGLRLRALMYTGAAFVVADVVAMVVRGSVDRPNVLWIAGLVVGAFVVALGAVCENHREVVLQRLRMLSARMESWR